VPGKTKRSKLLPPLHFPWKNNNLRTTMYALNFRKKVVYNGCGPHDRIESACGPAKAAELPEKGRFRKGCFF